VKGEGIDLRIEGEEGKESAGRIRKSKDGKVNRNGRML